MSTTVAVVIGVVVAVLVVALLSALLMRARRRRELRQQFGPEYDRTVQARGRRGKAEQELAARRERRDQLDIRPLPPASVARFQQEWAPIQAQFVDAPAPAVEAAGRLVGQVMRERGYPTEDSDERAAMLSVEHGQVIGDYRSAEEARLASQSSAANTEQLRTAMVGYRSVFERLLVDQQPGSGPSLETDAVPGRHESTTSGAATSQPPEAVL